MLDKLYSLQTYDDNSFKLIQTTVCGLSPLVHFGPFSKLLSAFVNLEGYNLKVWGFLHHRFGDLCLVSPKQEMYKLHTVKREKLFACADLVSLLPENIEALRVVTKIDYQYVYRDRIKDPFEALLKRYPVTPAKKEFMVGNQTLREYAIQQLGEIYG